MTYLPSYDVLHAECDERIRALRRLNADQAEHIRQLTEVNVTRARLIEELKGEIKSLNQLIDDDEHCAVCACKDRKP